MNDTSATSPHDPPVHNIKPESSGLKRGELVLLTASFRTGRSLLGGTATERIRSVGPPNSNTTKRDGFTFGALSPNDPTQVPLPFRSKDQAQRHADHMDANIHKWDDPNSLWWNRKHWVERPLPWRVVPLDPTTGLELEAPTAASHEHS